MSAEITRRGLIGMQVCVPKDWTDEQVLAFSEHENPCGTTNGWQVRRDGDPALAGDPERVPCEAKGGYIHIMVDA